MTAPDAPLPAPTPKCAKKIWHSFHSYPCGRKATSSDGKWCGIHDPERSKARAAKRGPTAWEREITARKAREAELRAEGFRAGIESAAKECDRLRCAADECGDSIYALQAYDFAENAIRALSPDAADHANE